MHALFLQKLDVNYIGTRVHQADKRLKGKTYFNHLLVESVATDKGPRHRVVCSLGSLEPAPPKEWRALARRMEEALDEQQALLIDKPLAALPEPGREGLRARWPRVGADSGEFDLEGLEFEQCREAGPVHVGHQMWEGLGLDQILSQAGLSDEAQLLSQRMTLNRLIAALDLTTPSGRALAGMLAIFAEFEHDILRDRVKAGIAQARKEGRPYVRPPSVTKYIPQVRALAKKGQSKSEISRRLRIGRTSVRRALKPLIKPWRR